MANKYWSKHLKVIYESAKDLHSIGLMNDAELKEFADGCIKPEEPSMATTRVAAPTTQRRLKVQR
jgi:DNA-binding transcriptional regulator YiaG